MSNPLTFYDPNGILKLMLSDVGYSQFNWYTIDISGITRYPTLINTTNSKAGIKVKADDRRI